MAATGDVAAVTPDLVDFDIDEVVDFDFGDLAADEFYEAYYAFVANSADATSKIVGGAGGATGGWLAGLRGDGDGGERSRDGSPDSAVTDGPLAGDEAMSAYVAELERFLMDDGDGEEEGEVFCAADGEHSILEELICGDDFLSDLLAASDLFNGIVTPASSGTPHDGDEENDDGVLAAREDEQTSRKRARQKIKGTQQP